MTCPESVSIGARSRRCCVVLASGMVKRGGYAFQIADASSVNAATIRRGRTVSVAIA